MRRDLQLLAEAAVIAEAPGNSVVPSGSRQYDSKNPSGSEDSLYGYLVERHAKMSAEDFIELAERMLRRVRKARRRPMTVEQRRYWIAKEPKHRSDEEVAREYGVEPQLVRQIRVGRTSKKPVRYASKGERVAVVKRLADEEGLSAREIAEQIRVSHTTVLRDLRDAA